MKPRFSVVVPAHNRKKFVGPAIDSILSQTFTDYETIIVDDGSTDGTWDVIQSYGTKITAVRQENQEPEVARQRGVNMASGEYMALMDSDDLFFPHTLATYDRIIRACDSPALIVGAVIDFLDGQAVPQAISVADRDIEVFRYRDYLSKDVSIGLYGSNMVIKKSVLDEAGGMRLSTPTTFHADQLDLVLRLGIYGPCIVVNRPMIAAYRVHNANSVRNVGAMVKGVAPIIEAERRGQYPGGSSRRFDRYACIGGVAWYWIGNALKGGPRGTAFQLLVRASPMVAAGVIKKLRCCMRRASRPLRVGENIEGYKES